LPCYRVAKETAAAKVYFGIRVASLPDLDTCQGRIPRLALKMNCVLQEGGPCRPWPYSLSIMSPQVYHNINEEPLQLLCKATALSFPALIVAADESSL